MTCERSHKGWLGEKLGMNYEQSGSGELSTLVILFCD